MTESAGRESTKKLIGIPSLMKSYKRFDRYEGVQTKVFDRNISFFYEQCERAGVNQENKQRACSIMLCGIALQHYSMHFSDEG